MNSARNNQTRGPMGAGGGFVQIPLKQLFQDCLTIGAFVAVGSLHRYAMLAVFFFLIAYAIKNTINAIRALSVLFLLIYLNPVLNIQFPQMMILRWGVFFAATLRIYFDLHQAGVGNLYKIRPVFYLHAFCAIAFLCNIFSNPTSPVGYLKLFAFAFGATAVFAGVALNSLSQSRIFSWLMAIVVVVIVGSLPFLATPAGYYSKMQSADISETGQYVQADPSLVGGFMGLLGHAQSFGTVGSLVGTFLFVTVAFSRFKPKWPIIGIFCLTLVMVYMSKARTGGVSMILACGVCAVVGLLSLSASRKPFKGIPMTTLVVIGLAGLIVIAASSVTGQGNIVSKFITKGSSDEVGLVDAYGGSRGGLIELSMNNFYNHPVFGIGFGRNSWEMIGGEVDLKQRGLLGLAFAPNEKGMILSAVLEETGVIGFIAFIIFLMSMYVYFIRNSNIYGVGLLTSAILLNFGEMSLFSMGGLGMLQWIFIAIASGLGDKCSEPIGSLRSFQRARGALPRRFAPGR